MGKLKILLKELTKYSGTPEMKSLWIFLILTGVLFVVNFFFLPAFLVWITAVVYLGLAFFMLISSLKTARADLGTEIKSRELKSIIESLDAGVISYDPNFRIITFNRVAENLFNINAQEIIGQSINPNFAKNPHFRQLTQVIFPSLAPMVRPISEPNVWPQIVDVTLEEPDCELRTILSRLTDEKGEVLGFFKIIRDRTRELAVLKSKSEFISVAAHQMRTPLNAIAWVFENLLKTVKDENTLETIKTGSEVSQRILKIVNDLLDVARIEEGKFGYVFENTDLKEFLETVLAQFKPIAEQYKINLYLTSPREPIMVQIDRQKLSVAFSNLIDNAIKYNVKNGRVEVSTEKLVNAPFVKVIVQDSGVGIPPIEMDKLFKKFFRGSNITQMEPNGSGLGLYITKNIVQRHGGRINAESIPDRGSVFYFTLPLDFSLIPAKEVSEGEI